MKKLFLCLLVFSLFIPWMTTEASASKGKILLIASSTDTLTLQNGKTMPTGFYLNELAVPAQYLSDHGYEIVLATPNGNKPVMDSGSNSSKFFKDQASYERALAFVASLQPIRIADADQQLDTFAGIFIPGGHAPMNDLVKDPDLYTALKFFHEHQKPTATICHGAAGLLAGMENAAAFREDLTTGNTKNAQTNSKDWLYKGYHMTAFSNAEELGGEIKMGTQMPFHVADALQIAGANIDEYTIFGSHVIRDRELVTGQNPASDEALAKTFYEVLQEHKIKA